MNAGDKVYCIRKSRYHTKGLIYKIHSMIINEETDFYNNFVFITVEYNRDIFAYSLVKRYNLDLFSDYFVELKEYRKLKLEKINESIEK